MPEVHSLQEEAVAEEQPEEAEAVATWQDECVSCPTSPEGMEC